MRGPVPSVSTRSDTRARIIDVAARLLQEEGPGAVTTRSVAQGAGVQAPAIYRLFGDKDGLLDAVAEHVMATYVSAKAAVAELEPAGGADPVEDLRAGWELQVEFGIANPTLFALLSAPGRGQQSPAAQIGLDILRSRVRRIAAAGRLLVSEERAMGLIRAAGTGAVLTVLSMPPETRDRGLPDAMFNGVLRSILTEAPFGQESDTVAAAATAIRAHAPQLPTLSPAESALMTEWLDRSISAMQGGQGRARQR